MKALFAVMLFGFSLLLQNSSVPQEQKSRPRTISTEPQEVVAELKIGDRTFEEVRGEIGFTPSAGNADDTLTGTLAFKISEAEQKRIAEGINLLRDKA